VQPDDQTAPPGAAEEIERFIALAAHDVRNPVAVMRASAQMAQRSIARGDMPAAQARLTAIVEQSERVTDILETFLDAARIDTGDFALRLERVDLSEVVHESTDRSRTLVGDHAQRSVEYDLPDECIGVWDRARVGRAVRALVTNALMYGDRASPVRISARHTGERVQLSVSGGGVGPTPDEADHLFERFYRGPSAADAGFAGSGLGLYTARGIARRHGGDVRHTQGDQFVIELPLAQTSTTNPV
jgi:signal transduction histidine kinase